MHVILGLTSSLETKMVGDYGLGKGDQVKGLLRKLHPGEIKEKGGWMLKE